MISWHLFNGSGFFVLQKQTITAVKKEVIHLPVPGTFDFKPSNALHILGLEAPHPAMKGKPRVKFRGPLTNEWAAQNGKASSVRSEWGWCWTQKAPIKCCRACIPTRGPGPTITGLFRICPGGTLPILTYFVSRAQDRVLVIVGH